MLGVVFHSFLTMKLDVSVTPTLYTFLPHVFIYHIMALVYFKYGRKICFYDNYIDLSATLLLYNLH